MQIRRPTGAVRDRLIGGNRLLTAAQCLYAPGHAVLVLPIPKNANSFLKAIFLMNHPGASDFDPGRTTALRYLSRNPHVRLSLPLRTIFRARACEKAVLLRDPAERLVSAFLDKLVKVRAAPQFDEAAFMQDLRRVTGYVGRLEDLTFARFLAYACGIPDWRRDRHIRSQASFIGAMHFDQWFAIESIDDLLAWLEGRGMRTVSPDSMLRHVTKRTAYRDSTHEDGLHCAHARVGELRTMNALPGVPELFNEELFCPFARAYKQDIELYRSLRGLSWNEYRARIRGIQMAEGIEERAP